MKITLVIPAQAGIQFLPDWSFCMLAAISIHCAKLNQSWRTIDKFIVANGGADDFMFNCPHATRAVEVELEFLTPRDNAVAYKVTLWLEDYTIGDLWVKNVIGGKTGR